MDKWGKRDTIKIKTEKGYTIYELNLKMMELYLIEQLF